MDKKQQERLLEKIAYCNELIDDWVNYIDGLSKQYAVDDEYFISEVERYSKSVKSLNEEISHYREQLPPKEPDICDIIAAEAA